MNYIQWTVFKGHIECIHLLLVSRLFNKDEDLIDVRDEMDNNLIHLAASINN